MTVDTNKMTLLNLVKGGHPVDGGKGGMYFFGRDSAIRTKASLLLEKDAVSINLCSLFYIF